MAETSDEVKQSDSYKLELTEAKRTYNSILDPEIEWIDYRKAGVSNQTELDNVIHRILGEVMMRKDIIAFGLRARVNAAENEEFCNGILEARGKFRESFAELGLHNAVEPFDPKKYNNFANVGENLLFGTSEDPAYEPASFPANKLIRSLIAEEGLEEQLFAMGKSIAETTVELFSGLSEDNPFFDQLEYLKPQELPEYQEAIGRVSGVKYKDVTEADKKRFLRLAFTYMESRHRLGLLDDTLRTRIVEARHKLHDKLGSLKANPVVFYDPEIYLSSASVMDNVLLGRISSSSAGAEEDVTEAILGILNELNLEQGIFRVGLNFNIGSGGKRMSETQRQKMHLARALLKNPDILIANQPLSALDPSSQKRILSLLLDWQKNKQENKPAIVWAPTDKSCAELFDRALKFEGNRIVADGTPLEVVDEKKLESELAGA